MNIAIGSTIKVVCQNGIIESGKVKEHNVKQLVLQLVDNSIVIIQKPDDNIVAIKIMSLEKESSEEGVVHVDVELKPDSYQRREDLRALKLAELHKLRANEERKRAAELLRSHIPSEISEVTFGLPNFTKPIPKHPKKKTG